MTKNLFEARLSDESIAALRSILGETIYTIYSPSLEARTNILTAFSLSLRLERKGYLVIDNERMETETDFVDYWQLSAEFLENPKYVKVETKENGLTYFRSPTSTIHLFEPQTPISRIEIYEEENYFIENAIDKARYDNALVFHLENKTRFCIKASSIPEALDFSEVSEVIDDLLKDSNLRMEI